MHSPLTYSQAVSQSAIENINEEKDYNTRKITTTVLVAASVGLITLIFKK